MYVRRFLFINDINEFFAESDNAFENTGRPFPQFFVLFHNVMAKGVTQF